MVFDYICNITSDYEGHYDSEELFHIVSCTIVKKSYKEFYIQIVTEELKQDEFTLTWHLVFQ